MDGTGSELCTIKDFFQKISCEKAGTQLSDCPKKLGRWANDGPCISVGSYPSCGPGIQNQTRTCTDGTGSEVCSLEDRKQTIKCTEAGTELPDCPKILGKWENDGYCIASGTNPFCGPGMQTQKRTCSDGTGVQLCTPNDRIQEIPCSEAGTALPHCAGMCVRF